MSDPSGAAHASHAGGTTKRALTVRQVIALVVVLILAVMVVTTAIVLGRAGVLTPALYWTLIGADIVVSALVAWGLVGAGRSGHKVRYVITLVLALVLIAGNGVGLWAGSLYGHLVRGIQTSPEVVQYDIIVPAAAPSNVVSLIGTTVAADKTDPLFAAMSTKVQTIVSVTVDGVADKDTAINATVSGQAKGAIIDDAYLQIMADGDPTRYAQIKIIASFTVPVADATGSGTPTPTPSVTPTPPAGADAPYIVYISGIDTAGPVSTRSRSDVNILMVVNPKTGKVLLVNTPRDFYVQLVGTTGLKDKLTHAGVYGIDVSVGTLNNLYDISINYYVRLNFSSLVSIINTLGGVDVDSQYDFTAQGYTYVKGVNHLDGDAALAFARDRHSFAAGDRTRGQNQEAVIAGVIAKLTQPSMLAHADQIVNDVSGVIQTSMTGAQISAQIQLQLANNTKWTVTSTSVTGGDGSQYTYSYPSQKLYVMIPDQATVDAAKAAIQATLAG